MHSKLKLTFSGVVFVAVLVVLFQNCGGTEGGDQLTIPSTAGGGVSYSASLTNFTTTPATNPTGFELAGRIRTSVSGEFDYRVVIADESGQALPNCSSTRLVTNSRQIVYSCSPGTALAAGSYTATVTGRHPSESRMRTLISETVIVQSNGGGGTSSVVVNPPTSPMVSQSGGSPSALQWTAPVQAVLPSGTTAQVRYEVRVIGPSTNPQTIVYDDLMTTSQTLMGLASGTYSWSVRTKATVGSMPPVFSSPVDGAPFTINQGNSQTGTFRVITAASLLSSQSQPCSRGTLYIWIETGDATTEGCLEPSSQTVCQYPNGFARVLGSHPHWSVGPNALSPGSTTLGLGFNHPLQNSTVFPVGSWRLHVRHGTNSWNREFAIVNCP